VTRRLASAGNKPHCGTRRLGHPIGKMTKEEKRKMLLFKIQHFGVLEVVSQKERRGAEKATIRRWAGGRSRGKLNQT